MQMLNRLWVNLIGRIGGLLPFRPILQPTIAALFALCAGWKNPCQNRVPYGWVILSDPNNRRELFREGWKDAAKVFVVAIITDNVYEILELRWFYPEEAILVATFLALVPYLLLSGPMNRIDRYWQHAEEPR